MPLNTWVTQVLVTNARLVDMDSSQLQIRNHATDKNQFVIALKDSEVIFGIARNAQPDRYQILTEQDVWNHQPAEEPTKSMVMLVTASSVHPVNMDGCQAMIEHTVRENHQLVDATRDSKKISGLVSTAQLVILLQTTTETASQLLNAMVTKSWDN